MSLLNKLTLNNNGVINTYELGNVIEGYYNRDDLKFYKDSEYTQEVNLESGLVYISLDTNIQYRYDEEASVLEAIGETIYKGSKNEINALIEAGKIPVDSLVIITDDIEGHDIAAKIVSYDNENSPLEATNVQDAIDEINGNLSNKVDKVEGKSLTSNDFTNAFANKLNGIQAGAQVNTITGVKGNAETNYRTGNVNITPANVGAININGDKMYGNLTMGGTSFNASPLIYWQDSRMNVWTGTRQDQDNNWFLWDAKNNRGVVVIPRNGNSPVFNGQVAWSNVTSKPALGQGYAASGSFYAVTSFGKFADSNNLLASSGGGNLYWGGNAWSDERLKKDINKTKVNGLDRINKINVVEYDFKDNKKYGGFHEIGFIAQELKEIIPDAVLEVPADDEDKKEYNTDTLLTINDSRLVPYLIKAVQELSKEVEELKNK